MDLRHNLLMDSSQAGGFQIKMTENMETRRDPGEDLTFQPAAIVIHAQMMALTSISEGL